ncbi:hypothetical protein M3Y96_01162200 [Aphelenchoides besseyi]|nr:hypothetical protein M3Y96_01162200 [Aphelenchoides besseyi]
MDLRFLVLLALCAVVALCDEKPKIEELKPEAGELGKEKTRAKRWYGYSPWGYGGYSPFYGGFSGFGYRPLGFGYSPFYSGYGGYGGGYSNFYGNYGYNSHSPWSGYSGYYYG